MYTIVKCTRLAHILKAIRQSSTYSVIYIMRIDGTLTKRHQFCRKPSQQGYPSLLDQRKKVFIEQMNAPLQYNFDEYALTQKTALV